MKQWYPVCVLYTVFAILLIAGVPALAQFRDPHITWIETPLNADKTVDGFYQSLPNDYANTTARYPLLIYLHGDESVEGTHENILDNSIPKLISNGTFPETFKVEERTHSFIVIAPHYTIKNLQADALGEAINNILRRYRVNTSRIYLTGMSRGGGYTWEYAGATMENATRLAAIVPIAGAAQPDQEKAAIIGDANLPVWATHNDADYLIPASNTTTYVDWINERKPNPRAAVTLFKSTEHEGWTRTYDPGSNEFKGKNVYEWMLQYTRSEEAPLPAILTSYKVFQSAASEVTFTWSITGDATGISFAVERSATQDNFTKIATLPLSSQQNTFTYIDKTPLPGDNYYRLSQIDAEGHVTYFPVLKISLNTTTQSVIALHPNPVFSQAVLQINHSETGPVTLSVFNTAGILMQHWTVEKETHSLQQSISFPQLSPGSYVLQVQGRTFLQSMQFIKQ